MRSSKASAENMVLKIVGNLDFKPSESAIDRATSYVEGLLKKSGDLFKIVSDPGRMDKVRAKVIEILVVGSAAKRNPARRSDESPLYVKYLSLKSDEEPFMMQGTKYEYVWAEYPGGIKDIGVYSYANDLVYSYDSFRQMMNLDRTATNPRDARASSRKEEYDDFSEWERDAFAAGATQIVKLGEGFSALRTKDGSMVKVDAEGYFDPRSRDAIKNRKNRINIGSWLGDSGTIYRHIIKNHPEFFAYENPIHSRNPRHRIAVRLSKSRQRNPVYDTGSDE